MIRYKYIIPVMCLIIGWISGCTIVSNRRNGVSGLLNEAGQKGLPVVVVSLAQYRNDEIIEPVVYISTIDHNPVRLIAGELVSSDPYVYFNDQGVIRFLRGNSSADRLISSWDIRIPDIYIQPGDETTNVIYEVYTAFRLLPASTSGYLTAILNPDGFQVDNLESGETDYYVFEPFPFAASENQYPNFRPIKISLDESTLVCCEYRANNDQRSYNDQRNVLWRYDIQDGSWTAIIKRETMTFFAVGPYGRVIGIYFERHGPSESIFIDGYTGETLHTIYGMDKFTIGERWIACREGTSRNHTGIVLIDMENNWEERRLTFPCDNFMGFAMYEPPGGGVEEMLRMRK